MPMPTRAPLSILVAIALSATMAGCGRPSVPAASVTGVGGSLATLGIDDAAAAERDLYAALFADWDLDHNGAISITEAHGSWLEADHATMDADHNGSLTRSEAERFFAAQGTQSTTAGPESLGAGLGIGAGLVGLGLAGYLTYTGIKGSGDLMYPKKETFAKPPSDYGLGYDRVEIKTPDGLKLVGWYVPASVPTTKAILLLHGHGSNKDTFFMKYGMWLQDEFNLFVYDARYHGESPGKFTTLGFYESRDAAVAFAELRALGNTSIGVMGESMGGATAIEMGAQVPECRAVWADCGFDSLYDAVAPRALKRKYPLPGPVAFSVVKTASLRAKGDLASADPIRWVQKIAPRPLFLVHGQKDDDTTPMNSEKLFAKAQDPKQIWRTPNAHHAESYKLYPEEYRERLRTFFEDAL